eukprot:gene7646-7849_t
MSQSINEGDKVAWNWGSGHAEGVVKEVSPEKVTITSKGKQITRNGTEDNPAVVIDSGKNPVVKKASEVHVMGDDDEVSKGEHVPTASHGNRS